jgi:hypothetical protein
MTPEADAAYYERPESSDGIKLVQAAHDAAILAYANTGRKKPFETIEDAMLFLGGASFQREKRRIGNAIAAFTKHIIEAK